MKLTRWLFVLWFSASTLSGSAAPPARSKLKVLTSILPVYCFTANVAGDLAEVSNLLPPGVGPHDYQLSPKDRRKVNEADLIVLNGLQLEAWLNPILHSDSRLRSQTVVEAASGLTTELIYGMASLDGLTRPAPDRPLASTPGRAPNPHVWLDPRLARHVVTNILRALQAADPAHAAGYARNAADYALRLEQLDEEIQRALEACPERAVITQHDAFAYFARRYGLHIVGVIEQVPEVEPSPKYVAALSRVAREKRVRAIFTEPQFSANLAQQLGRDLGIPVASLDTLESGLLQPTAYENGLKQNLRVLQKHLE